MRHRRWGRMITAFTLALDLLSISVLIYEAGGIASPLMSLLLIFSTLVALVFPHPLVALAPMIGMAGILTAQFQQGTEPDLMIFYVVWYGALNLVAVALVIHVGSRDRGTDHGDSRSGTTPEELSCGPRAKPHRSGDARRYRRSIVEHDYSVSNFSPAWPRIQRSKRRPMNSMSRHKPPSTSCDDPSSS